MSDKIGQFVVIGANSNRTFLNSIAGGIEHIAFLLRSYPRPRGEKFFIVQIVQEITRTDALLVENGSLETEVLVVSPKEEAPPASARDYGRDDIPGCRYKHLQHYCDPACGGVPRDAKPSSVPGVRVPVKGWTWKRGNRYYFVSDSSLKKAQWGNPFYIRSQTVKF